MATADKKDEFETLKNKGNDLFKAKKFKEAIEWYSKAIEAKGDEAVPFSNRALCFLNLGHYFDAIDDCDKAIKKDPKFVKAYYRRALAHKELFRYSKARDDFKKVLSLDDSLTQPKKELESLQRLLKDDPRLDLKLCNKPERFRSALPLKTFELKNLYSGQKSYVRG